LEFISYDEKKKLILGEINLTNEIRYQISIANDKESKEKFKKLLNKIEALRNLS
jgi:Spy/CpxP family protein refolding chaperone